MNGMKYAFSPVWGADTKNFTILPEALRKKKGAWAFGAWTAYSCVTLSWEVCFNDLLLDICKQ